MKAMGAPGEQEGATLLCCDEGGFVERVMVLADGFACDDASGEDNFGIAFVGRFREIQQCVFASA